MTAQKVEVEFGDLMETAQIMSEEFWKLPENDPRKELLEAAFWRENAISEVRERLNVCAVMCKRVYLMACTVEHEIAEAPFDSEFVPQFLSNCVGDNCLPRSPILEDLFSMMVESEILTLPAFWYDVLVHKDYLDLQERGETASFDQWITDHHLGEHTVVKLAGAPMYDEWHDAVAAVPDGCECFEYLFYKAKKVKKNVNVH
mgnify:FL=1|tara:strand:+ start:272 stop:877 length:606 start_codon:yes stop_codon:yes gene_type:complete